MLGNDELSRMCDTNDAWIASRTGIKERRIAAESENSGTMALEAAHRAIADAGIDARQIDMIIVCTVTPEMAVPSTACCSTASACRKKGSRPSIWGRRAAASSSAWLPPTPTCRPWEASTSSWSASTR